MASVIINIPQAAEQIAERLAKELARTKKAKVPDRKPTKKPADFNAGDDEEKENLKPIPIGYD